MLADFGAEVIKIEEPGGEPTRALGMKGNDGLFADLNRGKKSVVLDLKTGAGREGLLELVRSADGLVEGFRPGVMDRLGIGYSTLIGHNPRLIYVAVTGFGQYHPEATRAAHDVNYLAVAGLLDLIGTPGGMPAIPGFQIADINGTLHAVIGFLLALAARERTGRGQMVDVSMTHALAAFLPVPLAGVRATGTAPARGRERLSGRYACYNIYETADHRWMAVGALEPKFWAALCRELGCEQFIGEQFAEGEKRENILRDVAARFRSRTAEDWEARMRDKDVCCTRVLTLAEAPYWRETLLVAPLLSETPGFAAGTVPEVGEHNAELIQPCSNV
jgi:crotonobetainyl-CoA:carnitine CoA-transferase CaiB-like acyl-CoA transferase